MSSRDTEAHHPADGNLRKRQQFLKSRRWKELRALKHLEKRPCQKVNDGEWSSCTAYRFWERLRQWFPGFARWGQIHLQSYSGIEAKARGRILPRRLWTYINLPSVVIFSTMVMMVRILSAGSPYCGLLIFYPIRDRSSSPLISLNLAEAARFYPEVNDIYGLQRPKPWAYGIC